MDLQYSDVRPDKGLYNKLAAAGRFERIVTEAEVERAVLEPPEDTRAYFRGRCLAKYPDDVAAASWDSVIFDLPGHDSLQRVPTLEPLRHRPQALVGQRILAPYHVSITRPPRRARTSSEAAGRSSRSR